MARAKLSTAQARRIAIAAQGLHKSRPGSGVDRRHIRRVVRTLGLLQLDFVNVLVPAHYLVVFSRLGPYQRTRFNQLIYRSREFTEQWAHEASIVPMDTWPLLEYRRKTFKPWGNSPLRKRAADSGYLDQVIDIIREKGAITSRDLPPFDQPQRKPGEWHRSIPRWALECHFGTGRIAVGDRLPNFQRVYDLPERLIDDEHRRRPIDHDAARRELLRRAAMACGVASGKDLADYYRMPLRDAEPRLRELLDEGAISEVSVEGWSETAYLAANAAIPRRIDAAAILSPFDPLVWFRPRAERIFGFHYRIEIYVPAHKRKWGYYVLPFLLGDRIVARIDLKAERGTSTLLVQAAHLEEGANALKVAAALARELRELARWLDLEAIKVMRRGSLASALRKALMSGA
ncbi:MAG: winged helix-turn-helix domain-containing protein [Gammaproteobacteria bacterium]|nr:winged helix-turn-helix domain-containing protein [Gammaproteobacteria bacterium]